MKLFTMVALACAATLSFAQAPAPAKKKEIDPKLRECMTVNGKQHQALMNQHAAASKAGRIGPKEEAAFKGMEERMRKMRADLAKDGFTLEDCHKMGQQIAMEQRTLNNMAMTKGDEKMSPVQQCMVHNRDMAKGISAAYQKAQAAKKIEPAEQKAFQEMGQRMGNMQKALAKDGMSLQECQQIAKQMAADRAAVEKMAK
jgi:hypothetical protein